MADLTKLVERVKAATGPDRELDFLIMEAIYPDGMLRSDMSGHLSSSIDAALALVERVLPGWAWYVQKIEGVPSRAPTKDCEADLWVPAAKDAEIVWDGRCRFRADGPTAPLAILLALLSALSPNNGEGV